MTSGKAWLLALVLILAGSLLVESSVKKRVTLVVDGVSTARETTALTTSEFLRSAGVTLSEGDLLLPAASQWLRGGDTITVEHAAQVVILLEGEIYRITSTEDVPANLLLEAGIPLFPGDQIFSEGKEISADEKLAPAASRALQVRRAGVITLHNQGSSQTFSANTTTLGQALWEAGIDLYAKDALSLPLDTALQGRQVVTLKPSQAISIKTTGGLINTRSSAQTVGEALSEAGHPLQGLDFSSPPAEEEIPPDGLIQVVHVEEDILLETSAMPFETKTQPVADVELDQQAVVDPGRMGLKVRRISARFEDGKEVSRRLEGEYIAQEPQPRILGYGTKVVPHTLDTPDGSIKYWRALNMYAVSYNHSSNGGTGTATGIPLAKGVAAVDINYIPFYTQMYIPGYGHAVAADVGGGVEGRMIDLGYSDSDYVSWHQWVTVYFLWPPPATIPWIIP